MSDNALWAASHQAMRALDQLLAELRRRREVDELGQRRGLRG
jgi:hypothetical protein